MCRPARPAPIGQKCARARSKAAPTPRPQDQPPAPGARGQKARGQRCVDDGSQAWEKSFRVGTAFNPVPRSKRRPNELYRGPADRETAKWHAAAIARPVPKQLDTARVALSRRLLQPVAGAQAQQV